MGLKFKTKKSILKKGQTDDSEAKSGDFIKIVHHGKSSSGSQGDFGVWSNITQTNKDRIVVFYTKKELDLKLENTDDIQYDKFREIEMIVIGQILDRLLAFLRILKPTLTMPDFGRILHKMSVLIPKDSREEYLSDIYEMRLDLKCQGYKKLSIECQCLSEFGAVLFYSYWHKLVGYFYRTSNKRVK